MSELEPTPYPTRRARRQRGRWIVAASLLAGLVLAALGLQALSSQQVTPPAIVAYGLGLAVLVLLTLAAQRGGFPTGPRLVPAFARRSTAPARCNRSGCMGTVIQATCFGHPTARTLSI